MGVDYFIKSINLKNLPVFHPQCESHISFCHKYLNYCPEFSPDKFSALICVNSDSVWAELSPPGRDGGCTRDYRLNGYVTVSVICMSTVVWARCVAAGPYSPHVQYCSIVENVYNKCIYEHTHDACLFVFMYWICHSFNIELVYARLWSWGPLSALDQG